MLKYKIYYKCNKLIKIINKLYLKFKSNVENNESFSFDSASNTSCRRLSYMTGSKNARSWNLIDLPSIIFKTWRLKYIGHNSFCKRHNPINLDNNYNIVR